MWEGKILQCLRPLLSVVHLSMLTHSGDHKHVLLSERGNVNIQESIFGRMWGVSLEVVGKKGEGGESEADCGRSIKTYVGAVWSWGLVLLEALLWSWWHWLGKQSTCASLCSTALTADVRGGVLCTVTESWDTSGWGFEEGSSPSLQKDLLWESTETVENNCQRPTKQKNF